MLDTLAQAGVSLAESGALPDFLIRSGIRAGCANRLRKEQVLWRHPETRLSELVEALKKSKIAEATDLANSQHYELPPAFFELCLGPRLKYSSCYWPDGVATLEQAEKAALDETIAFAELRDGQEVLELGCGWGSLSLEMARRFPQSLILGVSNSADQKRFIDQGAANEGLRNLEVVTSDINTFEPGRRFDRVVSVEMFEHVRNLPALFGRIGGWVNPGARLFVHVFRHKDFAYLFETNGAGNWMGRHFFTGGVMPSRDLLPALASGWRLSDRREWDGTHYEKTANAWLRNLDAGKDGAVNILQAHYGDSAGRWLQRWRIFFMACAELFGYDKGSEWGVSHYRFEAH